MRIYLVTSLSDYNPNDYLGAYFLTEDGELYQAIANDELGGFGSVFKSIASVGIGFVKKLFGGGSGSGGSSSGQPNQIETANATIQQAANEVNTALDALLQSVNAGTITAPTAHAEVQRIIGAWQSKIYTNPQFNPTAEVTASIKQIDAQLAQKWEAVDRQADAVAQAKGQTAPDGNGGTTDWFYPAIGIGLVAMIFILRR